MIYDHIKKIEFCKGLSVNIITGLEFLSSVDPNIPIGVYQINKQVKAIVSEYDTKSVNEYEYEAHRRNIDIQYLINGEENIAFLPIERLKETQSYNEDNDVAFYAANLGIQPLFLNLVPGYFAILFPQDGHMPQLCVNTPRIVKKVVVKVKIGE